ncbi:hypothetical protein PMAYCL1PPCAC_18934, partial [Pristionchus mayeri]
LSEGVAVHIGPGEVLFQLATGCSSTHLISSGKKHQIAYSGRKLWRRVDSLGSSLMLLVSEAVKVVDETSGGKSIDGDGHEIRREWNEKRHQS